MNDMKPDPEFDSSRDVVDEFGYTLREIRPGHWHIVDGPNMAGWYCIGSSDGLTPSEVAKRLGGAS